MIDHVLPLGTETPVLYVPRKALERREWLAFLYPLRAEVWTFLLLNSLALLLALKIFEWFYRGKDFWTGNPIIIFVETIADFWMLGASYFGRKPNRSTTNEERAIRILLLLAFLSGNIVFMSYRASLTAELSVRRHASPFSTVEELSYSNYK